MTWGEKRITERRTAGALVLSKVRLMERAKQKDEVTLGSIGGFDLICSAGKGWFGAFAANLLLRRSSDDQPIDTEIDLTPTGLIARIEHMLERIPHEVHEHERKAQEAINRLAGYEERLGSPFAFQAELNAKLEQLAALEADLAKTGKQSLRDAA